MKQRPFVLAVLLGLAAGLTPAVALPLVTAYQTAAAPVLDGKLDEPCWQQATVCGPFVSAAGTNLHAVSQALVCWDTEIGRAHV